MNKTTKEVIRLFQLYTPAYTRPTVENNIKMSGIDSLKEDKLLEPMIHYIQALNIHKEYLDFFEIGVVRDQRKKIENVAKYVGLAIRDFSHADMDAKLTSNKNKEEDGGK